MILKIKNFSPQILIKLFLIIIFNFAFFLSVNAATPKYIKLADRLMRIYSQEMVKSTSLPIEQVGSGGSMMSDISRVFLHFFIYKTLSLEEMRVLYINMIENCVYIINQNQALRPYLHEYPFPIKGCDIVVSCFDPETKNISEKGVASVFISKNGNHIHFRKYHAQTMQFTDLLDEPYEVALDTVKESGQLHYNETLLRKLKLLPPST